MSKSRPKPPPLTATPSIGSQAWLRKHHPVRSFGPVVGSTSWLDLSAKRNQARAWVNEHARPRGPRIFIAGDTSATKGDGDEPCLVAVAISIVTIAKKTNNAMCYNELHKMKITKKDAFGRFRLMTF
jgi:hypothetical protein